MFLPVDVEPPAGQEATWLAGADPEPQSVAAPAASAAMTPTKLDVEPASIRIAKPTDYVQFLLTATLADGAKTDATRLARWNVTGDVGHVSADGRFTPASAGSGVVTAELAGQRVEIPVECALDAAYVPDFVRDVNPILSRLGCNQGTCHGAAKGKNGFKLSLRGYDSILDVRALTDDLASRRVNAASPDNSLMLLKGDGRRSSRRWAADHTGFPLLPHPPALDRQRCEARSVDACGWPRSRCCRTIRSCKTAATRSRCGSSPPIRRQPARRHPRGVHRQRQRRSGGREPPGSDDGRAARRGPGAGALRGCLRRHDAHRDGRPQRFCLAAARDLGPDR